MRPPGTQACAGFVLAAFLTLLVAGAQAQAVWDVSAFQVHIEQVDATCELHVVEQITYNLKSGSFSGLRGRRAIQVDGFKQIDLLSVSGPQGEAEPYDVSSSSVDGVWAAEWTFPGLGAVERTIILTYRVIQAVGIDTTGPEVRNLIDWEILGSASSSVRWPVEIRDFQVAVALTGAVNDAAVDFRAFGLSQPPVEPFVTVSTGLDGAIVTLLEYPLVAFVVPPPAYVQDPQAWGWRVAVAFPQTVPESACMDPEEDSNLVWLAVVLIVVIVAAGVAGCVVVSRRSDFFTNMAGGVSRSAHPATADGQSRQHTLASRVPGSVTSFAGQDSARPGSMHKPPLRLTEQQQHRHDNDASEATPSVMSERSRAFGPDDDDFRDDDDDDDRGENNNNNNNNTDLYTASEQSADMASQSSSIGTAAAAALVARYGRGAATRGRGNRATGSQQQQQQQYLSDDDDAVSEDEATVMSSQQSLGDGDRDSIGLASAAASLESSLNRLQQRAGRDSGVDTMSAATSVVEEPSPSPSLETSRPPPDCDDGHIATPERPQRVTIDAPTQASVLYGRPSMASRTMSVVSGTTTLDLGRTVDRAMNYHDDRSHRAQDHAALTTPQAAPAVSGRSTPRATPPASTKSTPKAVPAVSGRSTPRLRASAASTPKAAVSVSTRSTPRAGASVAERSEPAPAIPASASAENQGVERRIPPPARPPRTRWRPPLAVAATASSSPTTSPQASPARKAVVPLHLMSSSAAVSAAAAPAAPDAPPRRRRLRAAVAAATAAANPSRRLSKRSSLRIRKVNELIGMWEATGVDPTLEEESSAPGPEATASVPYTSYAPPQLSAQQQQKRKRQQQLPQPASGPSPVPPASAMTAASPAPMRLADLVTPAPAQTEGAPQRWRPPQKMTPEPVTSLRIQPPGPTTAPSPRRPRRRPNRRRDESTGAVGRDQQLVPRTRQGSKLYTRSGGVDGDQRLRRERLARQKDALKRGVIYVDGDRGRLAAGDIDVVLLDTWFDAAGGVLIAPEPEARSIWTRIAAKIGLGSKPDVVTDEDEL